MLDGNMRRNLPVQLPGGAGDLTLAELQEMSSRQQQQMEAQQQVLVAKEQRLKYLKQQEARHAQLASETEQLKRIRERVENQELKLKKLRALRGQAEQYRINNGHLTNELDAVKAVFTEKEKELALAVARVDQLTRQLQDLRGQGVTPGQPAAWAELDKLRKELVIRNKLNEQQSNTIAAKEKLLSQRRDEVSRMDSRIQELQQRLKKRRSQEQQANQNQAKKPATLSKSSVSTPPNVATVEPYIQYAPSNVVKDDLYKKLGHFAKEDPKYQTLPTSVKFRPSEEGGGQRKLPQEMNNNEAAEEYTLPTVLPVDAKPVRQQGLTDRPASQPGLTDRPASQPGKENQPVVTILEEERQAGSGQSSPASTEGSDSSGGLRVVKGDNEVNTSPLAPVSAMIERLNKSQPKHPPLGPPPPPPHHHAPHLNQKPAPTYRYASKNQIANTYLGRLGSAAMDRYQRNLNVLYRSQDAGGEADSGGQGRPAEGQMNQFGAVGSPNYPDIASDKGSYKLNTPKQVRRRHSDSENEEMNKALQEHKETEKTDQELRERAGQESPLSGQTGADKQQQQQTNGKEKPEADKQPPGKEQQQEEAKSSAGEAPDTGTSKAEKVMRRTKSNLKQEGGLRRSTNRVSFDPLALLLDASLEGELDLVKKVAVQVEDVSTANDEGITALHNAICAGHYDIVKFLVQFGCDVNSPDSDGWTPLHCAASCNNLPMVRFLVEHGACVFAATISDQETAADKCEEDEDGYEGCSDFLYSVQEKLGIANNGEVYAVFDYQATSTDELSFVTGDRLTVLRKGDDQEKDWWWSQRQGKEGYIPRNLLGLQPRVVPQPKEVSEC